MDPFIPKRRGTPNLDRRLAKKNIDYMSSTFSSSDAAPPPSSLRTRKLDISPLGNKTSFRIQGIDGEFDEICSSLGLSGPEDFSIAATGWEARKCPSALDRSRLHQIESPTGVDNMRSRFPFIDGVRSDDVRSNLKMAAPVSNQKILNDDETVDGGLMAPCRRGESADSEISSESVCSFVDSMTSISSTDFDALDSRAHLERAYHSGPIVFNSEKKDTREGLSGECLTKSALSFDDSKKRKSLPVDVNLSSFSEHASQDFDDFDFVGFRLKKKDCVGFDYGAGMLPNLKDELDSSREKPLVDFDAPNIKAHGLLVSNSKEKNMREASTRWCMTESVCSLVDSMPSISSTDSDALDKKSHLGRAYQSGPILFNSEQKDMREGLSGQWLTKSAPSFDDEQKLLSDVRILASSLELTSQVLYDIGDFDDFDGFDHCAGRLPILEDEKWATRKGYSLGDERPFEVSSLSMNEKLDSRLQFIHRSKFARSSPRALTLPDGGEIVGPVTLSLSEFAATNNRAHLVRQDQSGSTASHYECKNARETSDKQGLEDLKRHFGCKDKDVLKSLGVSVSMFKSTCRQHWVYCWPGQFENNEQQAFDATNNRAHLVKADESCPTVSNSEKGSTREALKRDCLTNALSLEDLRQHFGARHKDAEKGLCYSPTWKSFEVLHSLPLGERSNSIRHLARRRSLTHKHCVRLKKSQDLLRSLRRGCLGGLAPQRGKIS